MARHTVRRAVARTASALSLGAVAALALSQDPALTLADARVARVHAGCAEHRHHRDRHRYRCRRRVVRVRGSKRHVTPAPTTTTTATTTTTQAPAPPTTTTTPGPSPTPAWNGDISTGDWGQYSDCQSRHVDGVWPTYYTIVRASASLPLGPTGCSSDYGSGTAPNTETGPVPPGFSYAGKFTVGPDAVVPGEAGQRTLDTLWPSETPSDGPTQAYQGASSWYRDETYFPPGFQPIPDSDFNWTFEIHNWPDGFGDAMVSCGLDTTVAPGLGPYTDGVGGPATRYSCRVLGGGSPANPIDARTVNGDRLYTSRSWYKNPDVKWTYLAGVRSLRTAHWYDMVFHVRWSWQQDSRNGCTDPTSTTGCFEWWVDGRKVATWSGPTLLYYSDDNSDAAGSTAGPGQGYLDTGYYRSGAGTTTESVYHAAVMDGPSAVSIGENIP